MFQIIKQKYRLLKQSLISINWNINWEEERKYLDDLYSERKKKPKSYVYDSIFQYRAQIYKVELKDKILLNIICFFGSLFILIKSVFKFNVKFENKYDGVYYYSIDNIPINIRREKKIIFLNYDQSFLNFSDLLYLLKVLIKIRFNFILFSSVVFRISLTSYAIKKYNINLVLCDMEFSAASGVLHDYCSLKSIQLYNYMHGEKVLTLRDSFSSFDRFYVWDKKYENIFKKLYSNSEIIISNPWKEVSINRLKYKEKSLCYFFKGIEDESEILKIQTLFNDLICLGYIVYVKDHPRQSEVSKKFKNVNVIDKNISFIQLTSEYETFIAQFSTILTQSFCMELPFLIDDVSNPELFKRLKERRYPLSENNNLISVFLNGSFNNNSSL